MFPKKNQLSLFKKLINPCSIHVIPLPELQMHCDMWTKHLNVEVLHKASTFNHWCCVWDYVSGIILYLVLFSFQFRPM